MPCGAVRAARLGGAAGQHPCSGGGGEEAALRPEEGESPMGRTGDNSTLLVGEM